jgi:hypothetical protein
MVSADEPMEQKAQLGGVACTGVGWDASSSEVQVASVTVVLVLHQLLQSGGDITLFFS